MKIELQCLAGLLMSGTTLLFRMQIYGVEQALITTAVELGVKAVNAGKAIVSSVIGLPR